MGVDSSESRNPIPLNFFDAIQKFNILRNRPVPTKNQIDQINKFASNKDQFIVNRLEELTSFYLVEEGINFSKKANLPNITTECSLQLLQWFIAIKSKELWAISGILKKNYCYKLDQIKKIV